MKNEKTKQEYFIIRTRQGYLTGEVFGGALIVSKNIVDAKSFTESGLSVIRKEYPILMEFADIIAVDKQQN